MSEKITLHIPGTLSANITAYIAADRNWKITHVSAVASNDSDATLIVGNDGDTDAYIESAVIGDSGVPAEFDRDDFVDDQFPTHVKADVLVVTLDFDGDGGTAAQNVTIVITIDSY